MNSKKEILGLAIFGGEKTFSTVKSTSNLVQPNREKFYDYIENSYQKHQFTNNGPCVQLLENRLATIYDVEECVTFCNGLWAIVLALKVLALEGKTEIIMPSLTYRRMGDIAAWLNLTPRFCDVSKSTLAITRKEIEKCITDETAIILAPHPIVHLCNCEDIANFALEANIPVLFDSVEAAYATVNKQSIGGFGNAECFSMHASKFINGFEGGFLTTNDNNLATTLRNIRDFNSNSIDSINAFGMNAKLNEIHAAMTLANIDDIPDQIIRNKLLYRTYQNGLKQSGFNLVCYSEEETRTYKNILVQITAEWPFTREETISLMHMENMLVRPYYSPPLHQKSTTYKTIFENLSLTEQLSKEYLLLPSGDHVSIQDVEKICEFIHFIKNNSEQIVVGIRK